MDGKKNHSPTSEEERSKLEYLLQLTLGAPAVEVTRATTLFDAHDAEEFHQAHQSATPLDAWISVADLSNQLEKGRDAVLAELYENCSLPMPARRGGVVLSTGAVWPLEQSAKGYHEVVLCQIAVSRAYIVDENQYARLLSSEQKGINASTTKPLIRVPPGYDSIYLLSDSKSDEIPPSAGEGITSVVNTLKGPRLSTLRALNASRKYSHKYLVQDKTQVLPQYVIQFSIDEKETARRWRPPVCVLCRKSEAELYCPAEDAKLCVECDEKIHSANNLVARHKRTPLTQPSTGSFGGCPDHRGQKFEFFCRSCQRPVCVHCKMIGSHSEGEFAKHKLIHLEQEYQFAMDESRVPDSDLENHRKELERRLENIKVHMTAVERNCVEVEQQLYDMVAETVASLRAISQRKLSILVGDELSLRREQEKIEWVEGYLEYQRTALSPLDFIRNWKQHQLLRAGIGTTLIGHTRELEVKANIGLDGHISLVPRDASKEGGPLFSSATDDPGSGGKPQPSKSTGGIFFPTNRPANVKGSDTAGASSTYISHQLEVQVKKEIGSRVMGNNKGNIQDEGEEEVDVSFTLSEDSDSGGAP